MSLQNGLWVSRFPCRRTRQNTMQLVIMGNRVVTAHRDKAIPPFERGSKEIEGTVEVSPRTRRGETELGLTISIATVILTMGLRRREKSYKNGELLTPSCQSAPNTAFGPLNFFLGAGNIWQKHAGFWTKKNNHSSWG